jgi:hypothetical protein
VWNSLRVTATPVSSPSDGTDQSSYGTERELVEVLCDLVLSYVNAKSASAAWVVLQEQPTGSRIPDVLAARLDVDALQARAQGGWLTPLAPAELRLLRVLRHARASKPDKVAGWARVRPEQAKRILRRLQRRGFVVRSGAGDYTRVAPIKPLVTRVATFEAKLRDWKRALHQARAHLQHVNEAWVVYDKRFATAFDRGALHFHQDGIGLIAIEAGSNQVQLVRRARPSSPPDAIELAILGEQVLGRLLGEIMPRLPHARLPSAAAASVNPAPPRLAGPLSRSLPRVLRACARS